MRIKGTFNKDQIYFTSDTHFYHNNIIKYCDRPFEDISEMNKVLIDNWNSVVPVDGIVFHLGDFALNAKPKLVEDILSQLNGDIYFITGNHDKSVLRSSDIKAKFKNIFDICEIKVEDEEITYGEQHIIMCHYAMAVWNAKHRGSWQLFGHSHGYLKPTSPAQLDVGVDCHDFTPLSYQEVKELITKQMLE